MGQVVCEGGFFVWKECPLVCPAPRSRGPGRQADRLLLRRLVGTVSCSEAWRSTMTGSSCLSQPSSRSSMTTSPCSRAFFLSERAVCWFHNPRWQRMRSMTCGSSLRLMFSISWPQQGQLSGSTSQFFLMSSRQVFEGILLLETSSPSRMFSQRLIRDAGTGLHYNWHRGYNPKRVAYLAPDRIGSAGETMNSQSCLCSPCDFCKAVATIPRFVFFAIPIPVSTTAGYTMRRSTIRQEAVLQALSAGGVSRVGGPPEMVKRIRRSLENQRSAMNKL